MSEESLDDVLTDNNYGYQEETEYAGLWIRVGAALIDILVMIPLFVISYYNQIDMKSLVLLYILTVLSALYKPLMEWRYGATLGKMACKIKVVNEKLKPISIDQRLGRYIPWGISVIIQLMAATNIFTAAGFKTANTYMEIVALAQNYPLNTVSSIYSVILVVKNILNG